MLTLSDVDFQDRNNGWQCWRECDNFIEGLEWEDYRIKPKNTTEAQNGNLSSRAACDRGWTKFRCKAHEKEENPKGIRATCSWISCNHCEHYSPRTLEGRKQVLVKIRSEYEKVQSELTRKIGQLETELERQTSKKI